MKMRKKRRVLSSSSSSSSFRPLPKPDEPEPLGQPRLGPAPCGPAHPRLPDILRPVLRRLGPVEALRPPRVVEGAREVRRRRGWRAARVEGARRAAVGARDLSARRRRRGRAAAAAPEPAAEDVEAAVGEPGAAGQRLSDAAHPGRRERPGFDSLGAAQEAVPHQGPEVPPSAVASPLEDSSFVGGTDEGVSGPVNDHVLQGGERVLARVAPVSPVHAQLGARQPLQARLPGLLVVGAGGDPRPDGQVPPVSRGSVRDDVALVGEPDGDGADEVIVEPLRGVIPHHSRAREEVDASQAREARRRRGGI